MSVSDVRDFEAALAEKGLKPQELMRRAGAVVALQAARLVEGGSVVVLCGMGNNGGDGWVAADNLARHGYEVNVVSAATPAVMKSELARRMATRVAEMGIPVYVNPSPEELVPLLRHADVVVDAVFGTGFSGTMPSPYDTWVQAVDEAFEGAVVSVDVPSGISAVTGMSAGPHFEADVTVTMFAVKPGLISGEGRLASGNVVVASLVTDDEGVSSISDAAAAFALTDKDYFDVLPDPDPLRDKYTRGRVLVVAGSSRYPGAAVMAAKAAARSGAGYVTLVVPEPVVPVAQNHLLSIPVVGLPADADGSFAATAADRVAALAEKADVVLAGPGMTTSFGACEMVRQLLAAPVALVLDADALNVAVKICTGSAEEHPAPLRREFPLVLTPHRRELARLMGVEPAATASLAQAMYAAQHLAWSVGSADFCVVAKGPVSAVSTIDGTLIPQPGPAALATAGTGDVLSGMVASLLAQKLVLLEPEEALDSSDLLLLMAAADRVHALAGFLAVERHGSRGVVAPDVADLAGLAVDALVETADRAYEESPDDMGGRLEGALAFEDEARITPPPEVERLIKADASARAVKLPGELKGYEGELEEPEPQPEVGEPQDEADAEVVPEPGAPADAAVQEAEQPEGVAEAAVLREGSGDAVADEAGNADDADDVLARDGSAVPARDDEPADGPVPAAVPPFLANAGVRVVPTEEGAEDPAPAEAPAVEEASDGAAEAKVEAAAVEQPQDGRPPVPPFLARAVEAAATVEPLPAVDDAPAEAEDEEGGWEPTPEELERRRLAAFHERATLHIDAETVTPVEERPSARPRKRR